MRLNEIDDIEEKLKELKNAESKILFMVILFVILKHFLLLTAIFLLKKFHAFKIQTFKNIRFFFI